MVRPRTFFDFTIEGTPAGRVVFELFNDIAPKTVENFRALCTGELGKSKINEDVTLHYKGSFIHRSIANFMVQGGDFTRHNGKGGESIYGSPFADENLKEDLDREGLLVMANKGPGTNGSQWFITLRPCPHLTGKHVVFGKVVTGYNVVEKIADVPVDDKSRPLQEVKIVHCGELELRKVPAKAPAPTPVSRSQSISSSEEPGHAKKRRDRSASANESDSESRKKHRKKHKGKGEKHRKSARPQSPRADKEETEAELDARLEREEKERLALERKRKIEEIKKREPLEEASGGIRYKGTSPLSVVYLLLTLYIGRGRMKYRDPETNLRGW